MQDPATASTHALQEIVVYYDETKRAAEGAYKGHVLLFVPVRLHVTYRTPMFGETHDEYSPIAALYAELMKARQRHHIEQRKLHFNQISGRKWYGNDYGYLAASRTAVDALRHKRSSIFQPPLCCKLGVMFYPHNADLSRYGGHDRKEKGMRHDETILRILLKGALHLLYDQETPVVLTKMVCDGKPQHRPLDDYRVLHSLAFEEFVGRAPLRDYVEIPATASAIHLSSDHKDYAEGTTEYIDANMLQLADLLLGSAMRSCFAGIPDCPTCPQTGATTHAKKDIVAYPVSTMLAKSKRGAGFKNSGHYRSFTVSQICFASGTPQFTQLHPLQASDLNSPQHMCLWAGEEGN